MIKIFIGPRRSLEGYPEAGSDAPVDLVDRGQQESGGQVSGETRLSIPSPNHCVYTRKASVFLRCLDTHAHKCSYTEQFQSAFYSVFSRNNVEIAPVYGNALKFGITY